MKTILKILSFIGLGLTCIPSIILFIGGIDMKTNFNMMIVGTVLYFGSAVFWMKSKPLEEEE